ncbi:MAG: hypothetical protein LBH65_06000, partial [Desulfovibrio sp.]|nr:hypothetical protein [Desulfovibrio sp.]
MVNGKLVMTYGGSPTPAKAPQRNNRFNRGADAFSAYLTKETPAQAVNAPQTPQTSQTSQAPRAVRAKSQPLPATRAGDTDTRLHLGHMPESYLSGRARDFGQAMPTGQSRAQARELVRPAAQTMSAHANAPGMTTLAAQPQALAAKSAPRISGRPITGRNQIGMVDTRKMAQGRSTLAGRGDLNYASPTANAALEQSLGQDMNRMQSAHAPRQNAFVARNTQADMYARFSTRFGADYSGQSFIAHGFAGKNAEIAMKNMGYDRQEARNLQTFARRLEPDPYALKSKDSAPPGTTFGSTRPVEFAQGEDKSRTAVLTRSHKRKTGEPSRRSYPANSLVTTFYNKADKGLGALAAKFESGEEGIAAIGYDRKGGTSYGKYQIASRPGTMSSFISYLQENAPDIATRLTSAGPANTGGRSGKMPQEWRKIASEQPDRFEQLQSDFIRTSHFEPAMQAINAVTGVAFERMPSALQEVLFSTAVQHGPAGATRIISQALRRVDAEKLQAD